MKDSEKSAAGDILLSEAQRKTLAAVLNLIIAPSDDGRMPGAAEYDIWGYIHDAARTLASGIRDELERLDTQARAQQGKPFATLDEAARQTLLEQMRAAEPRFMRDLARQTVACYYQQDRVLVAIGMQPRPPFPLGYEVAAGDLSLLDPVRARGRVYREV
jgi:hypothetical protein